VANVNASFIVSLVIIFLGYVGKKVHLVRESDGEGISRIVFNFTLPATIIGTFSRIQIHLSLFSISLISLFYGLVMAAFAIFVFRKYQGKQRGMLALLVPSFNIGLFAYPLVEAIWGKEGIKYFGMFDMGNSFIVFGVCYIIASIYSSDKPVVDLKTLTGKVIGSVPLLSYILALVLNVAGVSLPVLIINITDVLSKANMALSLLLLGIYLNFKFDSSYWKNIGKVLLMRYVPGVLVGVVLYFALPFEPMYRITMLIGLSLPVSLSVIPYSVQFGYDSKFVGTLSNITIIISFLLMWLATFAVAA
jgi:predicted permease